MEQPASLIYFVGIVIGVGGLGAWIAFDTSIKSAVENWGTYTIAIAASAAVDGMLGRTTARRSINVLVWTVAILAGALALVGYLKSEWPHAIWLEVAGSLCAWFVWVIASGRDERFKDEPTAPLGLNPNASLSGSLDGFKQE